MGDPKKFAKSYKLEKRAPKGVDPEKHERCVHQVKQQGRSVGSAHAICTAAMKKGDKKEFVKHYKKVKKSYDYKNQQVMLDSKDVAVAEDSAFPPLVDYIQNCIYASNNDITKVNLAKGMLTVTKKAEGLYAGFFQDHDGQIVEQFDNMTVPMIAKNLEVKALYDRPLPPPEPVQTVPDVEDVVEDALEHHNAIYHRGQEPGEPINGDGGYVRIKYGDFELEIKKSMHDFIKSFKADQPTKADIRKALASWRRNSKAASQFKTDVDAAQALLSDWNQYGEDFNQVLFALKMKNEK